MSNSYNDYNVYYGDLHNHCAVSYAHGPLSAALENAKEQLDFVSITGHADWPDMPEPDERIQYIIDFHNQGFKKFRNSWEHYNKTVEKFHKDGEFVAFPGYEIHSCDDGDYTFVYKEAFQELILGPINEVKEKLVGKDVIGFPHHIAYPVGSRGINWESFHDGLSPVIEILSMHGMSIDCESPRPFYHSMGPIDYHGTIAYGLTHGHKLGFLGCTDHHSAYPGSYGHGKTGVWAKDLTRESLWEAILARRTYAVTGDKVALEFSINGVCMGDVIDSGAGEVEFNVNAHSAIDCIDLIKNNELIERWSPRAKEDRDEEEFESHLYVELGWGEKHKAFEWNGEVCLKEGEILEVEPRFRGMEVVSPVEREKGLDIPFRNGEVKKVDHNIAEFKVVSRGNPTNVTPATQGFNLKSKLKNDGEVVLSVGEQKFSVDVKRLKSGSYSRNLGLIDSPAFRIHRLPHMSECLYSGAFKFHELKKGDFVYLKVRLKNNQYAISSPVYVS
ncbi:MAG: DUF3604 domain-containing protein [Bacteriovoracaceae bacterium]